jgi:hypothetical protein
MAQRGPARPTAHIEEAMGFVGMFGILFLGVTVFSELAGRPALGWALTLLVCVLGVVVLDRWRVSVLRRTASTSAPTDGSARTVRVARRVQAAPAVPAAPSTPVVRGLPGGRASTGGAGAGGRVHRHVGWDELAPAGRQPVRARRRGDVAALDGGPGGAGRHDDDAAAVAPVVAIHADRAVPSAGVPRPARVAGPARADRAPDVTRPSDG